MFGFPHGDFYIVVTGSGVVKITSNEVQTKRTNTHLQFVVFILVLSTGFARDEEMKEGG